MARLDQTAGHAKLKSEEPLFCLHCQETSIVRYIFISYAIGAVARVNRMINYFNACVYQSCFPGMNVCWTLARSCPLVGLGGVWGHG